MGVPGMFRSLSERYKRHIIKIKGEVQENGLPTEIEPMDALFFDFNCLIHPICRQVWLENKAKNISMTTKEFERKVMEKCIEYMEMKVQEVNPISTVGIFIDGVCPMAKIAQQRQRRFASILDKEIMNNIKHKHGVEKDEYYDTNSITPGTEMMETFHKYLINYVNEQNSKGNNIFNYVYSSYKEIGEAEHKIVHYIKKNCLKDKTYCIYGLDADLIILSMTLVVNGYKLYLYRENSKAANNDDNIAHMGMLYFDVNACAKAIANELSSNKNINYDNMRNVMPYVIDFVFITLLLGNDFIPPNPTLNMRFMTKELNGYDILMHVYKSLFRNKDDTHVDTFVATYDFTNRRLIINWSAYKELINGLATFEEQYFKGQSNYRNFKKCDSKDMAAIQIFRMENLMFKFPDPLKMSDEKIPYEIRKKRYIHHYYGTSVCKCTMEGKNKTYHSQLLSNTNEMADNFYEDKELTIGDNYSKIIATYLGTMSYIMTYYFDECPDNLYYYRYMSSILLSDFYEFLNKNPVDKLDEIIDTFGQNRNNKGTITPIMQLMLVLPTKSFYLLPTNVYKLLTGAFKVSKEIEYILNMYKTYFPKTPNRDFIFKNKLFQASLVLSIPNIDTVITLLTSVNVSKDEEERNMLLN
jgi:5'-3' exonuclease